MNRIPPIHALLAFEASARHGSMAAAAGELCVTPSAISHRIRQLEEFIGQTLIERGGSQWWLTAAGHDYLRIVRAGLETLGTLPRTPLLRQRLRVAVPPTFGRQLFVPRLNDFLERYPEIDLTVQLTIPLLDVRGEESDVEIRFGNGVYQDVVTERLIAETVFPVASPAYVAAQGPFKQPADLQRARLLKSPLEPWAPWLEVAGAAGAELPGAPQFNDAGLLMEAAMAGQGIALGRMSLCKPWLEAGKLVRVTDLEVPSPHGYWLTYRQPSLERQEVRLFVDWLKATLNG
jgi:DNA-binding transcriptional LysR family regulator